MKYYVYSGYVSPDNCGGERATHELREFNTEQEVLKYHEEFKRQLNEECSLVTFFIIKGKELNIQPEQVVTKYKLV